MADLVPAATAARVAAQMRLERDEIERVVDGLEETLASYPLSPEPARVVIHGVAGMVHDFYTGVEKLFHGLSPALNGHLPEGERWHRELLHTMVLDLPGIRPPLLSTDVEQALVEYLKFRHLYRNLYGFRLQWSRVRELAGGVRGLWTTVRADVEAFLAYLDRLAAEPMTAD